MARTHAPLFSLEASGTIAKSITFSKWKGRPYVRQTVVPANPKSGLQTGMRAGLKFTSQAYAGLSTTAKANWQATAAPNSITALNAQVSKTQKSIRQGNGPIHDPTDGSDPTPSAPATFTATALVKSILLQLTSGATPGTYVNMFWMSKTTGFTPSAATLVAISDIAVLAATIPDLVTGTTYYFRCAQANKDGTIGALHAEISQTPA